MFVSRENGQLLVVLVGNTYFISIFKHLGIKQFGKRIT